MKRKGLVGLVGLLVLIGCGGCIGFFNLNLQDYPKNQSVSYEVAIASDDAKDVHVYLPFPHYKGKPNKKVLKWLKENFSRNVKHSIKTAEKECRKNKLYYEKFYKPLSESYRKIKLDLVDTEYGKMLYIYIPDFPEYEKPGFLGKKEKAGSYGFTTDKGGGSREIKINPDTVIQDYKLTCEDKIKDEDIESSPLDERGYYAKSSFKLPVYAQFKGENLKIYLHYDIGTYGQYGGFPCFVYWLLGTGASYEVEEYYPLNSSGWQWVSLIKKTPYLLMKDKEIKEDERE